MKANEAIKYLQQLYPNGGHCWLDEQRIEAIDMAIDALKEVPVSEDLEEASKEWLRPQLDKSYANYGEVKMMELTHFDGYAMLDAIEFGAEWQKEKDAILPKVWNRENLDDFSYQTAYDLSNDWAKETPTWHDVEMACKLGAKWQKEQFEKNRLAACDRQTEEEAEIEQSFLMGIIECEHRQPTFDDAIKYGMRLQKENMMKGAVNGLVFAQRTNEEVMFRSNYVKKEGFEFGDKVKMILIKEE